MRQNIQLCEGLSFHRETVNLNELKVKTNKLLEF